jgi:PPM family protein phosphatase
VSGPQGGASFPRVVTARDVKRQWGMKTALAVQAAAATHVGRRKQNEDSHGVDLRHGLFLVADGMGGYEGGEVASSLAAGTMLDFVARDARDPEGTWPIRAQPGRSYDESLLAAAVRAAHLEIAARREAADDRLLSEMGSTVAAVLCRGAEAVVAHVGDSRIYRLRGKELRQLTRDHSLQAEMAAAGLSWPHRNVITRALGIPSNHTPDVARLELAPGDVFLLCSDGLYEVTPDATLAALLEESEPEVAARALVEEALRRGASDNVTVVVVRVQSSTSSATSP